MSGTRAPRPWLRAAILWHGRLLLQICVRKIQSVDQEFFVFLLVGVRPFFPSLLPRKLAAFFAFGPLVLPALFFDKVGDPEEWIGLHHRRERHVFVKLQNFAHLASINPSLSCSVNSRPC